MDSPGYTIFVLVCVCGAIALQPRTGRKIKNMTYDTSRTEIVAQNKRQRALSAYFGKEYDVIKQAAERNGCRGDDFLILLAIRKAENGRAGFEFGVVAVKNTDLDTQAGWAAATVVKNRQRWIKAGRPGEAENDPTGLNKNWVKNVKFWYKKFKKEADRCGLS